MKSIKNRVLMCFLFICTGLMLAGCSYGGTVNTNLTVERDSSGVRSMQVVVNTEVVEKNFSGDISEIKRLIEDNCPGIFEYTYVSDGSGTTMKFDIPFSSTEEYEEKVKSILPNAEISVKTANLPWSSGLTVSENFTSVELLSWLSAKMVEEELISSDNSKYVLEEGTSTITFGGNVYSSKGKLSCDNYNEIRLAKIYILTDVVDVDSFNRSFIFLVEKESIGDGKKDIKVLLESKVGDDAKATVNDNIDYVNYTVSSQNLSEEELTAITTKLFPKSVIRFGEDYKHDFFGNTVSINESLSVADYLCSENQTIKIYDLVKVPENYEVPKEMQSITQDYPDYYVASRGEAGLNANSELSIYANKDFCIKQVDITTKYISKNNFKREFVFTFEGNHSSEEIKRATNKINDVLDKTLTPADDESNKAKIETAVKSGKDKEGNDYISVSIRGDMTSVSAKTAAFTGKQSTLNCDTDRLFVKLFFNRTVVDTFDLSGIVTKCSDDFLMNYAIDMGAASRINLCDIETAVVESQKASFTGKNVKGTSVTAYSWNVYGLLFWLGIIAAVVISSLILIKSKKGEGNTESHQKKISFDIKKINPFKKK